MRMLAFSDLHLDGQRADELVSMSHESHVVIGVGDYARFRVGLRRMIDALRAITVPVLLVPGNNETESALRRACARWENATVLHGQGAEIGETKFFGLGGGVPPTGLPFSFDLTEEQAAAKLAACPKGAVLIAHSPPKGHVDAVRGRHLGSEAVLRAIETKQPPLAVCGHVHESWGSEAKIGATRVVNVGPEGKFFEL
jgi:Icc-related predicted phosphoesterase